VWAVAFYLWHKQDSIVIPAMTKAPRHADYRQHQDNGDIYLVGRPGGKPEMRVEVKRISKNFSGPKDWPYGNKFIVCPVSRFDNVRPTPGVVIIVSNDLCNLGIVWAGTKEHWWVAPCPDKKRPDDKPKPTYYTHPKRVEYVNLMEDLE
jgi:hypothetical protein